MDGGEKRGYWGLIKVNQRTLQCNETHQVLFEKGASKDRD
jgi:hypothetical protein